MVCVKNDDVLNPAATNVNPESVHNNKIVDRSSGSVSGDVSTATPDVVDVMFKGQGYSRAQPNAGLCLSISSASSSLAQPGMGVNPASPRKSLGKRKHTQSSASSGPGGFKRASLTESDGVSLPTHCTVSKGDAPAMSLFVSDSGELNFPVSRHNEALYGSCPDLPAMAACSVPPTDVAHTGFGSDVPATAACTVPPTGSDQPFRCSASREVEAEYQGFVQALRTTPTRPLLGVIPRWQAAQCVIPRWILNILRLGYRLQFQDSPPPFLGVLVTTLASEELMSALSGEVEVLLQKDAIELVPPHLVMEGHYSRYFLVEKRADKGGGLRPIMDLRGLNPFLSKMWFKMISNRELLEGISHGEWFSSIDLKDAYFHISIHPQSRKYLRFFFQGQAYQYKVLPFGYALAPRTFSLVLQTALEPLLRRGIIVRFYIDDLLIQSSSKAQAMLDTQAVVHHLSSLGFSINVGKSSFQPRQTAVYLGIQLDSVSMVARLADLRVEATLSLASRVHSSPKVSSGSIQRLLGLMASACALVPMGLLYARLLQRWYARLHLHPVRDQGLMLRIPPHVLPTLGHWTCRSYLMAGVPMGTRSDHVTVFTDASPLGWGGVLDGLHVGGEWPPHETRHSNVKELLAVLLVLQRFLPHLRGRHVLIRSDNVATCAYINKGGGSHSPQLHSVASEILHWSQLHLRSIRASHIRGILNTAADLMSRGGPVELEWSLHPDIVSQIWSLFGQASVDLFATSRNTKCPLWFSGHSESTLSLGVDAFRHSPWPPGLLYAFPPVPLVLQLLHRVRREKLRVIMVVPDAPRARWFPLLARLGVCPPWLVPLRPDALSQAGGLILRPPTLQGCRLVVWLTQG